MKSQFLTALDVSLKTDKIWVLAKPLKYYSEMLGKTIEVPEGFETDFASVPRLPIVYTLWGNQTHREPILHDWGYRKDSGLTFSQANKLFLEAMEATGKPFYIRYPMYYAVCACGYPSFHKLSIHDKL